MKPQAVARAEVALRGRAVEWTAVGRGYTSAERWCVRLEDGSSAFVKAAVDEETSEWLRQEATVYAEVRGSFLPRMLAWDDEAQPLFVLEDLSAADWPPPRSAARVRSVLEALDAVAATAPADGLGRLESQRRRFEAWRDVAGGPEPFLSLGLCSPGWLDSVLPALIESSDAAVLDGEPLLHLDVRSDNICVRNGRAMLVYWNHTTAGNPAFDIVCWLPSLTMEDGPEPEEVAQGVPGIGELASVAASYFGARAGLPPLPRASGVRPLQLAQLQVALPWALRELGLPALDR